MENLSGSIRPLLVGMVSGLIAGLLVLDIMVPLGLAAVIYVALVMLSLSSTKPAFTLATAAACTALVVLDMKYPRTGVSTSFLMASRGLGLVAIWSTAVLSFLRSQDQEDIQALRSLLHLCATCKRIRDKKGTWHQLEHYLKANTELEFSRALCPECRKKWVAGSRSA